MRTAILLAVHIGGEITELLRGRETSLDEQRAEFKRLRLAGDNHDKWEALELWHSDCGIVAKHKFKPMPSAAASIAPVAPAAPIEPDALPAAPTPVLTPDPTPKSATPPPEAGAEPSGDDAGEPEPEPVEGEVAAPDDDDHEPDAPPALIKRAPRRR